MCVREKRVLEADGAPTATAEGHDALEGVLRTGQFGGLQHHERRGLAPPGSSALAARRRARRLGGRSRRGAGSRDLRLGDLAPHRAEHADEEQVEQDEEADLEDGQQLLGHGA